MRFTPLYTKNTPLYFSKSPRVYWLTPTTPLTPIKYITSINPKSVHKSTRFVFLLLIKKSGVNGVTGVDHMVIGLEPTPLLFLTGVSGVKP